MLATSLASILRYHYVVLGGRSSQSQTQVTPSRNPAGLGLTHKYTIATGNCIMDMSTMLRAAGLMESDVDHLSIFKDLPFKETTKKRVAYSKVDLVTEKTIDDMPALSYGTSSEKFTVDTITSDGKETTNTAEVGDFVVSGPSKEKYVLKATKFKQMYDEVAYPAQMPRKVAQYDGKKSFEFVASWGEKMIVKPGDYVVKEGPTKYYRIAKREFEQSYNQPK